MLQAESHSAVRLAGPVENFAARSLAAACALNLNGAINMASGTGQVVSGVMLLASLTLLATTRRQPWSNSLSLLLAALVGYLFLGTLFHHPMETAFEPEKYYQAYGGAILILWAASKYTSQLQGQELARWLVFLRNTFLVSAASVWASPLLYQYYLHLPPSAQQRMGGFFGNPNEAAMAAVIAIALTLNLPMRSRLLQLAAIGTASGAVVLTFSKTGISCMILVIAWHVLRRTRGPALAIAPVCGLALLVALDDPKSALETLVDNPLLELDPSQKSRLLAAGQILTGQIDETTSTGRTFLWSLVLERALEEFPFASGIGSAHHIHGGIYENDTWQGAHNTFLMVLGESGLLPAALLLAAIITAFVSTVRRSDLPCAAPCLIAVTIDMMATHTALATRYDNLILAVVLGLIANRGAARSEFTPAVPTFHLMRKPGMGPLG